MVQQLLSFVLRVMMIALVLLGGLQLLALLAGTSNPFQAVLVTGACVSLTYKMAMIDNRLVRARRKLRLQITIAAEPIRVA